MENFHVEAGRDFYRKIMEGNGWNWGYKSDSHMSYSLKSLSGII